METYPGELGMTPNAAHIARALGVSEATFSRWRSQKQAMTVAQVAALAAVLKVRACWLAFGEGVMR